MKLIGGAHNIKEINIKKSKIVLTFFFLDYLKHLIQIKKVI